MNNILVLTVFVLLLLILYKKQDMIFRLLSDSKPQKKEIPLQVQHNPIKNKPEKEEKKPEIKKCKKKIKEVTIDNISQISLKSASNDTLNDLINGSLSEDNSLFDSQENNSL